MNNNSRTYPRRSDLRKFAKVRPSRGFTLIETLIAVLLLTTAITGPLTIASKGLTATLVAKDQFTAFYLAQDAIEHVRFLRDSACLSAVAGLSGCPPESWLASLSACVSADGCNIDSIQSTVTSCSGVCSALNYDSVNHFFSYTSGSISPQRFIRTIKITNASPDEAVVTIVVSWSDVAGVTRAPVTVRENIFRWQ